MHPHKCGLQITRKLQPVAMGQKTTTMGLREAGLIIVTLFPKGSVVGGLGKPGIQGVVSQYRENFPALRRLVQKILSEALVRVSVDG